MNSNPNEQPNVAPNPQPGEDSNALPVLPAEGRKIPQNNQYHLEDFNEVIRRAALGNQAKSQT